MPVGAATPRPSARRFRGGSMAVPSVEGPDRGRATNTPPDGGLLALVLTPGSNVYICPYRYVHLYLWLGTRASGASAGTTPTARRGSSTPRSRSSPRTVWRAPPTA